MDDQGSRPNLSTDSRLLATLEELRAREPIFHRRELGTTRASFEAQTSPDFWEVGASGRRYSRAFVWTTLEERWSNPREDPWETSDFHCRELADDTYALTYTLRQRKRLTRRLTIWRRTAGGWVILYHQGTQVAD